MVTPRRLNCAPIPPVALPELSQSFTLQLNAQTSPPPPHDAQFTAISVDITAFYGQGKWPSVKQFGQAARCSRAKFCLARASWMANFGGVDIGNANLAALIPEGVAIDDTCHPARPTTADKYGAISIR